MVIPGENGQIRLEFMETIPEGVPHATDVCCSVDVTCAGFRGRDDSVWFSREIIERFLTELRQLESTRQGQATLPDYAYGCGSEYDGVGITLYCIDGWGHIAARIEIAKPHYDRNTQCKKSVWVEFEIDVEQFSAIVSEFTDLLAPRHC